MPKAEFFGLCLLVTRQWTARRIQRTFICISTMTANHENIWQDRQTYTRTKTCYIAVNQYKASDSSITDNILDHFKFVNGPNRLHASQTVADDATSMNLLSIFFFGLFRRSRFTDVFLRVPDDVVGTKARLYLPKVLEQMKAPLCLATRRRWSYGWRSYPSREENFTVAIWCQHLRLPTVTLRWLLYDTFFQ